MKYIEEFRSKNAIESLSKDIEAASKTPIKIMEICGGQTNSIVKFGLHQLLPSQIELIHGPGCPVCVTPMESIDLAIELSKNPKNIICTFSDMLRVPSSKGSLAEAKAAGSSIKSLYSPMEALEVAEAHPSHEVILFAVGFETTAPLHAATIKGAHRRQLKNFSALTALVQVPPAINAIMSDPETQVDAMLAAGHVCTIMGEQPYHPLCEAYKIPIVITGFEPVDILQGILCAVRQFEQGTFHLENQYRRVVGPKGNQVAQALLEEVFISSSQSWRGIGDIPSSGFQMREAYQFYDATSRFGELSPNSFEDEHRCQAGSILKGLMKPQDCPQFGNSCNPDYPLGAPMVSHEGACAAYYNHGSLNP